MQLVEQIVSGPDTGDFESELLQAYSVIVFLSKARNSLDLAEVEITILHVKQNILHDIVPLPRAVQPHETSGLILLLFFVVIKSLLHVVLRENATFLN